MGNFNNTQKPTTDKTDTMGKTGQSNSKESVAHKIGDAIERFGDKIEHSGMIKVGDAIEALGDKIEHLGEKKSADKTADKKKTA